MEPHRSGPNQPAVIVLVGETASGKTALAVELARLFGGEVISADSRTVYRGMDVGTAKPTMAERQGIVHYGIDVVSPDERFTAYDFQQMAYGAIEDATARGKLAIIAGGTGLYVDSVLYDFQFRPFMDEALRAEIEPLSVEALQQRVLSLGLSLPENAANRRHLIRLIEAGQAPTQPRHLRPNTLVLGLQVPRELLQQRVSRRAERMITEDLLDETKRLYDQYGDIEPLKAPAYAAARSYLDGAITRENMVQRIVRADLQLAKRQRTWWRRSNNVQWIDYGDDRFAYIAARVKTFLETH